MIEVIENSLIKITAGDTAEITITPESTDYAFTDADLAVFTVRERIDKNIVIQKRIVPAASGTVFVKFAHEDTADLKDEIYDWDIRYIIAPQLNSEGEIEEEASRYTPMYAGGFRVYRSIGGA